MSKHIINILNHTWGFLMTLIGYVVRIVLAFGKVQGHDLGVARFYVVGRNWGGVSLGTTILVSEDSDEDTIAHELGHTIQNARWGLLFPFVIAIPSAIRYWYRRYLIGSGKKEWWELPDYDSVWFEGQATKLGESFLKNHK
jgi:hypothetical protein